MEKLINKTGELNEELARRHSEGIMRVEDPRETIETICSITGETIDYATFKRMYETKYKNGKQISRSHAEAHFYSLSVLGIIEKILKPAKYRLSERGRQLCVALRNRDSTLYQETLRNLLLENKDKGEYIAKFLAFLQSQRTFSEITNKYKRAGRSLIAWCKEAGLIKYDERSKLYWSVLKRINSIEEFWDRLNEIYSRESRFIGKRKGLFVRVDTLKRSLVPLLGSDELFEKYIGELMRDSRYRQKLELSGAPIAYVERERLKPVIYNNRRYYFLSISA